MFGKYLKTYKQALVYKPNLTESAFNKMRADKRKCVCGRKAWKWAQTGLCFSCTTGHSDASEDIEVF